MFEVVQDFLSGVLGMDWWMELISVVTDEAGKITERYQGVVMQIEHFFNSFSSYLINITPAWPLCCVFVVLGSQRIRSKPTFQA